MLQSLCDTSPEVRQAAAYGVGVMAQYGGESYRPFCTGTDKPPVRYGSTYCSCMSSAP